MDISWCIQSLRHVHGVTGLTPRSRYGPGCAPVQSVHLYGFTLIALMWLHLSPKMPNQILGSFFFYYTALFQRVPFRFTRVDSPNMSQFTHFYIVPLNITMSLLLLCSTVPSIQTLVREIESSVTPAVSLILTSHVLYTLSLLLFFFSPIFPSVLLSRPRSVFLPLNFFFSPYFLPRSPCSFWCLSFSLYLSLSPPTFSYHPFTPYSASAVGAVWHRRPPGARLPENHPASHLWKILGPARFHPQTNQQHFLTVKLYTGKTCTDGSICFSNTTWLMLKGASFLTKTQCGSLRISLCGDRFYFIDSKQVVRSLLNWDRQRRRPRPLR